MVVAINKIDKPGADVDRVTQELAGQAELLPEEWGGDTPFVRISAKRGTGITELLETLALVAEVEDLQANPGRAAEGTVLEALLDRKAGPLCTLLVQAGTLHVREGRGRGERSMRPLSAVVSTPSPCTPTLPASLSGG